MVPRCDVMVEVICASLPVSGPRRRHYNARMYNDSVRRLVLAAMILASACAPGPSAATPARLVLIPYETTTPLPSPEVPSEVVVVADTPLATSTPSQYTIRAGDTLSQIAEQHRITLDALMLANPQANPGALRVGEVVDVIPLHDAAFPLWCLSRNFSVGENRPLTVSVRKLYWR